jgi:hypothetical protein
MFKDAELDRLGVIRDRAYSDLCLARDEKNRLGQMCSRLHDELDAAYKAQNRAYEAQQSAWESHRSFMQDCSNKIEFYKAESDRHHGNMVRAFQQASNCHDARDGAGAKSWSNEGHNCKAQMRSAKEQISFWVSQSRDSKYRFENGGYKANFESAKQLTARLKIEFAEASARYKPVKYLYLQRQTEFNQAKKVFDERLNWLEDQRKGRILRLGMVALNIPKYKEYAIEKWNTQVGRNFQHGNKKSNIYVAVKSGWSRDHNMPVTDIIVRDKANPGKHYHLIIGENGEDLLSEWRNDHR